MQDLSSSVTYWFRMGSSYVAAVGCIEVLGLVIVMLSSSQPCGNSFVSIDLRRSVSNAFWSGNSICMTRMSSADSMPTVRGSGKDSLGRGL